MKKTVSPEQRHEQTLATLEALRVEILNAIRRVRYAASDLEGGR